MPSSSRFAAYACAFIAAFVGWVGAKANKDPVGKFDGTVVLYSDTNYRNTLLSVNIQYPYQCYNIDCSFLDNKVESVEWKGLPSTDNTGKAYIFFYEDFDCNGYETAVMLPNSGGISDFDMQKKVKGQISAFMVKSQLKLVDNGFSNVCSWAGANVVGGSVSQDNSISMVNATV